jgi:hypothetical protein
MPARDGRYVLKGLYSTKQGEALDLVLPPRGNRTAGSFSEDDS